MATLYRANGTVEPHRPANGLSYTLKELQGLVGGYIEEIRGPNTSRLIVNEDGKRLNLPYNVRATTLARDPGWRIGSDDFIVGDALLIEDKTEID